MATRRTTQRMFLGTPNRFVRNAFLYCLGWAANKWAVQTHCFAMMSNHHHIQFTDPWGVASACLADFYRHLAKVMTITASPAWCISPMPFAAIRRTSWRIRYRPVS